MTDYGTCFWCKREVTDGGEVSGYEGYRRDAGLVPWPDWMDDGDFGCDAHPISGEDGTGPHETLTDVRFVVTAYHLADEGVTLESLRASAVQTGVK